MLVSLIGSRALFWKFNIWIRFEMYKGQKKKTPSSFWG